MDYSSMAVNYARRQRQSPVLSSGISKQNMHKSSSPLSKRWSMYDNSVFATAAMNFVDTPVRMRPASMIMTTSMPVTSYMAPAPMAMASPYMPTTNDGMVFSPSLVMQHQQQQAMYSPVFSSPAYYASQSFAMMPTAAQQQPMAYASYADYPPTLPESAPSAFDVLPMSTPDFDFDASAQSPKFTAPLTPVQDSSMSTSTARPTEAVVDDEEEGEILHGMGLYDKFDADLSLDSSRDSMQSLVQDTTRAAMPTKMLLLENFEPEMAKDEEEEEEEEEEVAEEQQEQVQQQQQAPAMVSDEVQQLMDMTPAFYAPLYTAPQTMVYGQSMVWI